MEKARRPVMPELRIGISGWSYPEFYYHYYPKGLPSRDQLSFFAKEFDCVELNRSFYSLPRVTSFEAWDEKTPDDFAMAIKASRLITHDTHLENATEPLNKLLTNAKSLGKKLGPVLFQLPPNWKLDLGRLAEFLTLLPNGFRYAIELRDRSWLKNSVFKLLSEHEVAHCVYDLQGFTAPAELTADFTYVRLHGPTRARYKGSYHGAKLEEWARRIDDWRTQGIDTWVFFDNTMDLSAVKDARELKAMFGQSRNQAA